MKSLVGMRFGRWTVIEFSRREASSYYWKCRCDCGNEGTPQSGSLVGGRSVSCGCFQRQTASERGVHWLSKSGLYTSYRAMLGRCLNPKHTNWKHYGGRGITVCERWLESFLNFQEDMGPTWVEGLTLDRIDGEKNYEPENCRWLTMKAQCLNKKATHKLETPWGVMSINEAAKRANLDWTTLKRRVTTWPQEHWFDPPNSGFTIRRD